MITQLVVGTVISSHEPEAATALPVAYLASAQTAHADPCEATGSAVAASTLMRRNDSTND